MISLIYHVKSYTKFYLQKIEMMNLKVIVSHKKLVHFKLILIETNFKISHHNFETCHFEYRVLQFKKIDK